MMAGNGYIYPVIAPDLSLNHSGANIYTFKWFVLKNDPAFAKSCKVHTIEAVFDYQDTNFIMFAKELALDPSYLKKNPFKELFIQDRPVNKTKTNTKFTLWHHQLDHHYDEY